MHRHMKESSRLWDYEVLDQLGRGEYGQVFKVKNKRNGQIYALKKVNISSCHVNLVLKVGEVKDSGFSLN